MRDGILYAVEIWSADNTLAWKSMPTRECRYHIITLTWYQNLNAIMIFKQRVLIMLQQLNGEIKYKSNKTNHTRNGQVLLRNLQYIHHNNIWCTIYYKQVDFECMSNEFESSKWIRLYLTKSLTQGLPINIRVQIDNSPMPNNSNKK